MTNYKTYINALRNCAKEHENDITPFAHIRVSDLCRDTANLLEELEQEPIIDKIRAEIEQLPITDTAIRLVTEILDKYKVESEDKKCKS